MQTSEGYQCLLEISKAEKSDVGSYRVVAKNEKGSITSAEVKLTADMLEEEVSTCFLINFFTIRITDKDC